MGKKFFLKTSEVKRLANGNLVEVTRFFGKNGDQLEWRVKILHKVRRGNKKEATDAV